MERFKELNDIFKLDMNRRISRLSKGQQMRLSFMLATAQRPELLVLDEPTSGLDAIAKKQLLDIIIDEADKGDTAVIISSHHLSELEKLCDEITLMQNGRAVYQSGIDEIKSHVKKFQVVFDRAPDEAILGNYFGVEKIGSIYYLTTPNFDENTLSELKRMGASLIEEIGMSLEEIFIFTAEGR